MFNMHSKLEEPKEEDKGMDIDEDDQIWQCEFCSKRNVVNLEGPEITKQAAVNYILENAKAEENKEKAEGGQSIVFCVDISGSMCVSKPMQGKFKIKGDRT